jgi:hypothetical protein
MEMYYGEYVDREFSRVHKFCSFDMPVVGNEDLYFTVNPSLYLGEQQLREILYDLSVHGVQRHNLFRTVVRRMGGNA